MAKIKVIKVRKLAALDMEALRDSLVSFPGSGELIRDILLGLPENERSFIISSASTGKHKVFEFHRNEMGNIEYGYETEPES